MAPHPSALGNRISRRRLLRGLHPQHPHVQALLNAIPEPDPGTRRRHRLPLRNVDSASLLRIPPGCSFHPRCPRFEAGLCNALRPELSVLRDDHSAACHMVAREHAAAVAR
jgi:peptide/nickel transport system ATP-binding protein